MKAELDALPPLSPKSQELLTTPSTSSPEKVCVVILHQLLAGDNRLLPLSRKRKSNLHQSILLEAAMA